MKRLNLLWALMALLIVTSCSKDDEPGNGFAYSDENLVGVYNLEEVQSDGDVWTAELILMEDGTASYKSYIDGSLSFGYEDLTWGHLWSDVRSEGQNYEAVETYLSDGSRHLNFMVKTNTDGSIYLKGIGVFNKTGVISDLDDKNDGQSDTTTEYDEADFIGKWINTSWDVYIDLKADGIGEQKDPSEQVYDVSWNIEKVESVDDQGNDVMVDAIVITDDSDMFTQLIIENVNNVITLYDEDNTIRYSKE
nr:hypothetical protein [uncultured Carboxylicivirga sp.]